jgi:hypothetical protein
MKPTLFNLSAAISVLLFTVLLVAWALGQFGDVMHVRVVNHSLLLFGADGIDATRAERYFFDPTAERNTLPFEGVNGLLTSLRDGSLFGLPVRTTRVAGVELYSGDPGNGRGYRAVMVPVVYLVAMAALLPALWLTSTLRRRRRAATGRCTACGYDLRGTRAGGRCPECGATPAPVEAA